MRDTAAVADSNGTRDRVLLIDLLSAVTGLVQAVSEARSRCELDI